MADESDSRDPRALHGLAASLGDGVADLRRLRDRLARAPDDPATRLQIGRLFAELGRTAAALRHFERAAAGAPQQADAHRCVARTLYALGHHEDSIPAFRRTVALDPSDARDWLMLGVALRLTRRAGEAQECLEKSLSLDAANAEGWYELGLALENLGRGREARAAQQRALQIDPGSVPARTAEASLAAREAAEREPPPVAPGKIERVAFHINKVFHYSILKPLFDAFQRTHRVLFTADAINLVDFDPDVVVVCDAQPKALRPLLPRAVFVNVRHGAGPTKNFAKRATRHADYVCAYSAATRDDLAASGWVRPDRIWVTGYVPMDPMFRGQILPPPFALAPGRKVVLFAPTYNPYLSAAPMLGRRVAELLRGGREDVTIVIKPHPYTAERNPSWMAWWRAVAGREPHVHLVDDPAADVTPCLQAADVLVSDVSATAFQFLPLDRPMILVTNPDRAKDTEHFDPDGLEWRCRDMADEVSDVERLPVAVDRALREPNARAERRRHYRDLLFGGFADGRAVERLHAHISGLAKG